MKKVKAKIIGTGSYLPEKVLSNQDLERMVETSDEWIVSRTGMKERRIARDDEYTSDMGASAARLAISDAGLEAEDIDFILVATLTPDYLFPSTACLIQNAIGAKRASGADIQAACTGYLYLLMMAKSFVESGVYKNVLVVAAEKLSSITNYKDRSTCVLFGDGAAACVVSSEGKGLSVESIQLGSDGEQSNLIIMPAGGCRLPASQETVAEGQHYIKMAGNEVFKHAVRRMETACKECLNAAGITEQEVSWLIPHQANMRIIDAIAKRFEHLPPERIFKTVQKYGNTSASSVGIALDELLKTAPLKQGEQILLTAFGAGLTWGAGILRAE
ncbi:MAG: 3-oxoacyl-ACP synthase [Chlamydiae bacterium CG10_big_fil_rev_8_21_14_0_10_42_34]|nr:MAG: 3-oxoacyl-ACP synthase [Chlamydiae bacterium CG10_big_fil_rev_8_21_14_0_10_42_34]